MLRTGPRRRSLARNVVKNSETGKPTRDRPRGRSRRDVRDYVRLCYRNPSSASRRVKSAALTILEIFLTRAEKHGRGPRLARMMLGFLMRNQIGWLLALAGIGLFVFSAVALTGPGRVDIVDGLTRYEVARSLVEYGDSAIRDERITFLVFTGREGRRYTNYRFPHSALGAAAIVAADLTGPVSEPRRHFFFSLVGAAACAALAAVYAVWFRSQGQSPPAALLWSAAGVFCSPIWFYGTTTFDESLGTIAVVAALVAAILTRRANPAVGAAVAGLLIGLAVHCKPPLGIFVLAALAGNADEHAPLRSQWPRFAWMLGGLGLGLTAYFAYDLYKFPPGAADVAGEYAAQRYVPLWPGRPLIGFLGLTMSPGTGALWYWPPLAIALYGLKVWRRGEPWLGPWFIAASAIYVVFIATLTFFSGEPSWGPRYLTPLFGLLWLFAPAATTTMRRGVVAALLAAGLLVQIAGLSVETTRFFFERPGSNLDYFRDPWFYFRPSASKLLVRPAEIAAILGDCDLRASHFTPASAPTFPVFVPVEDGSIDVRNYHVLNSLRPWWISQRYLEPSERPVDLAKTAELLLILAGLGLAAMCPAFAGGVKVRGGRMSYRAARLGEPEALASG